HNANPPWKAVALSPLRQCGGGPLSIARLHLVLSDKLTFIAPSLQLAARNFFLRTLRVTNMQSRHPLLAYWADGFRMFSAKNNLLRLMMDRQVLALAQRVFYLLHTDFDFQ